MKGDIQYSNLMIALEKLDARLNDIQESVKKLSSDNVENEKVSPEDFSNFLEFNKLKEEGVV